MKCARCDRNIEDEDRYPVSIGRSHHEGAVSGELCYPCLRTIAVEFIIKKREIDVLKAAQN